MEYLVIKAKPNYFLPMMDSIGKRRIHFLWDSENHIIIDGAENVSKVKKNLEHY